MSAGVSDESVFTIPSEEMNISTCIYFSYDASIIIVFQNTTTES